MSPNNVSGPNKANEKTHGSPNNAVPAYAHTHTHTHTHPHTHTHTYRERMQFFNNHFVIVTKNAFSQRKMKVTNISWMIMHWE
jgi:hypothetical protein